MSKIANSVQENMTLEALGGLASLLILFQSCQVSLGLKEDEEGSQAPNASRVIFSCTELAIFDTSRSTAQKLALVPGSR